jgi:hypothetical protein
MAHSPNDEAAEGPHHQRYDHRLPALLALDAVDQPPEAGNVRGEVGQPARRAGERAALTGKRVLGLEGLATGAMISLIVVKMSADGSIPNNVVNTLHGGRYTGLLAQQFGDGGVLAVVLPRIPRRLQKLHAVSFALHCGL